MKRIFLLIVAIFATSALLISCNNGSSASNGDGGKKLIISLETNPTTGFDWQYEFANGSSLKLEDAKEEVNNKDGMVGAPILRHYTFSAEKQGDVTLKFTYKRNWEGGDTAYSLVYKINVDSNNNIKVLSETLEGNTSGSVMKHSYTYE